jgi:plastocyanin
MRTLALVAVAALAALALAGCSGSSNDNGNGMSMSGSMSGSMMMAKTVAVAMKGNKFVNETVTVYVGDTVKWTNQDTVSHSVTTDSGAAESFDSNPNCAAPVLPAPACTPGGGTYSHTFTKAGTTKYHCRVHSMMTGTVIVLDHSGMSMSGSMSMSMSHSSSSSSSSSTSTSPA